jgi:hypothetical protein
MAMSITILGTITLRTLTVNIQTRFVLTLILKNLTQNNGTRDSDIPNNDREKRL